MRYRLFVDDERYPAQEDWIIARSCEEAIAYVRELGMPTHVAFDHDLGGALSGYDLALFLTNHALDGNPFPDDFSYSIHSMNPIGRMNIQGLMNSFLREYNK